MTNVNQDDQPNVDNQDAPSDSGSGAGLPLRGFAMVLIAVAVMLGLWGLYALTQGGDSENTDAAGGETAATAPGDAEGSAGADASGNGEGEGEDAEGNAADANGANGAEGDVEATEANGTNTEMAEDGDNPGGGEPGAAGAEDAAGDADTDTAAASERSGEGSTATAAEAEPRINVLNNSTVNGLAESVYADLEARGLEVGVHGNLPDEVAILQETTIYYEQGDAAGEEAATELADQIASTNGVQVATEPNFDGLPEDVTGEGAITLALIGEVVIP